MERTIFLFFLCTAVTGEVGKHIFISKPLTWSLAQDYCRQQYTDLSCIDDQRNQDQVQAAAGYPRRYITGWIGLHRIKPHINTWMWSGGGFNTYTNWAPGQPDDFLHSEQVVQLLHDGTWNDDDELKALPFYCLSINVVEVKMTWEGALSHCRENYVDFASLISETENLLALNKTQQDQITEGVWVGLRYLAGSWLWVNNDPLVYEAWPQGDQDHQYPLWKHCGALNMEGLWENRDCQEKLKFICI